MKTFFTLTINLLFCCLLSAQTTATFEDIPLLIDTYLNGSETGSGLSDYTNGNIGLPNVYIEEWDSWTGWAISALTDTETQGIGNQYSSIAGGGAEGSEQYAVAFFANTEINFLNDATGKGVDGCYVTNNAYAYYSMLNGDAFAKKFGGETGDDPDYLKLTFEGKVAGITNGNTVDVYLADYRFDDNSQDFILDEWLWVDLSSLGNVDQVSLTWETTDVGDFGANTPLYACIDNFTTSDMVVGNQNLIEQSIEVYPNPTKAQLSVNWKTSEAAYELRSISGTLVQTGKLNEGTNNLSLQELSAGIYFLRAANENGSWIQKIIRE